MWEGRDIPYGLNAPMVLIYRCLRGVLLTGTWDASLPQGRPLFAGRYRILDTLGRGGMAAVYRAHDVASGRTVALKALEQADERLTPHFEREYHTLASLKHPRVIEVYEFGITPEGLRYYTMELLPGADLLRAAPLPYREACAHIRDVSTCLALLHARRLLHRDVSPLNVRLDAHGRAKLLDFGALGDFGLARELVGTPPFMAPEAARHLPLDQRSDLFSLGATLYFALTKTAPFPARRIEDVLEAQRTAPAPPSKLAPDIPPELDGLVLSLLSLDPMERPSSAAEVVDRLAAIADLDVEPRPGLAESHLLSSALVGRNREKAQLRSHVARALRGEGSVVRIEGTSGMGRTRLSHELAVDARIAGMTVLRIDALSHSRPSGTLRAAVHALLEAAPTEALAALPKYAHVLVPAFQELKAHAQADASASRLPKDAAERRALLQATFVEWLLHVCRARPLLLIIDDVQAVDLDSAGVLLHLAHAAVRARLLLAVTQDRDAPVPMLIQQVTRMAAHVPLRRLNAEEVDQLIASVFGDVPHRARLSQWLLAAGHGNPGHSLELLKQLVDRGLIRYSGGAWALPSALPEQELPKGLDEALEARLCALDPEVRRLALSFALHRGTLSLRVCLGLVPHQSAAQVLSALDQLVGLDILVRSEDVYRFGREATRALLLRNASAEELQELHAALAQALTSERPDLVEAALVHRLEQCTTQDLDLLQQTAAHLERGGEAARGRELMRKAAVELTMRGDGLTAAVPALEAAVVDHRAQGRPAPDLLPLLVPLTLAGTYSDFRLSYRYGEEALDLLLDVSGLTWARKLARFVGRPLALALGMGAAWVRAYVTGNVLSVVGFREAILAVLGVGTGLLGTFSVLLDKERARRVAERLEVLAWFPKHHAVRWVHLLQRALLAVTFGDAASACRDAMRVFEALRGPGRIRSIREDARLQLLVGCLTPVSIAYGLRVDGKVHAVLDALDRLRTSVSRQIAAGSRAIYHGHRGERSKFIAYHEEMDVLASQAGSTWREDVGTPRQMWTTYLLCEDVMGLKGAAHELDALAEELPAIRALRDATRACYLCERGMPEQALREYGALFEEAVREPGLHGVRFAGAYARILRLAGQPARGKVVCEQALARVSPENREFMVATFGAELELVLCTAALGELDEAAQRLDEMFKAHRGHDNPLLHGLLYKARARLAILSSDAEGFAKHADRMDSWFRRTGNPALIGQCHRLWEEAKHAGLLEVERTHASEPAESGKAQHVAAAFQVCRGPGERLQAAIDLVLSKTGAEHAYLYLLESSGLRFAAPAFGAEPSDVVRRRLEARVERLRDHPWLARTEGLFQSTIDDLELEAGASQRPGTRYAPLLLTFPQGEEIVVVGAIAVVVGADPLQKLSASFLNAIARAIYAAGDVRSVYFDSSDAFVTVQERPAPTTQR